MMIDKQQDKINSYPIFKKCIQYNLPQELKATEAYCFLRELIPSQTQENKFLCNQKEVINFGSNHYLGLQANPEVIEAGLDVIEKYGVGSGGSRLLNATLDLHNTLEKKLAKFKGAEDCMVYSTGCSTNMGVVSTLVTKEDYIIMDSLSHSSLIDGAFLAGAKTLFFDHNNMKDLARKLSKIPENAVKLIVTDGIFSMDGDIAKLNEIYELGENYNTPILLDDAHATGVLGENGTGTAELFGLKGKIAITTGTLGKALGCIGGFVTGSSEFISYLKHNSRTFMFTTSLPATVCASLIKAIEIVEKEPELRRRLWRNVATIKQALLEKGLNIGTTATPIIPILLGDELLSCKFAKRLEEEGIFLNAVIYPAVPTGAARLRICVSATHTEEQIIFLIESITKVGKELGVILP